MAHPLYRPRRLRESPLLRRMVRETRLGVENLILPLFAVPGRDQRREVSSMPGVFQLSVDQILVEARAAHGAGVPSVILFGLPDTKDALEYLYVFPKPWRYLDTGSLAGIELNLGCRAIFAAE